MKEKITFQGALGAFSHIAAGKYFGLDIDLYPALTFDALFKNVSSASAVTESFPSRTQRRGVSIKTMTF